jgi:hypothetical protein
MKRNANEVQNYRNKTFLTVSPTKAMTVSSKSESQSSQSLHIKKAAAG